MIYAQIADFIQEDRAVVRQLEIAAPVRCGPGKAAFAMAEEFAFEEIRGDGCHIDSDEGFAGPWTEPVDRPGK